MEGVTCMLAAVATVVFVFKVELLLGRGVVGARGAVTAGWAVATTTVVVDSRLSVVVDRGGVVDELEPYVVVSFWFRPTAVETTAGRLSSPMRVVAARLAEPATTDAIKMSRRERRPCAIGSRSVWGPLTGGQSAYPSRSLNRCSPVCA